jgi:hypothetical protein
MNSKSREKVGTTDPKPAFRPPAREHASGLPAIKSSIKETVGSVKKLVTAQNAVKSSKSIDKPRPQPTIKCETPKRPPAYGRSGKAAGSGKGK